jgi:hypothetical protein
MGMFDTLLVKKSLLKGVIPEEYEPFLESGDGYYDFQTKDLMNLMFYYYLEEDLHLYVKEYSWDGEQSRAEEKKKTNETQYITYYDLFTTKTESIFLTIKSHIVDGKLYGSELVSIEKTNLEEEAIKLKKSKEKWARQEARWEMKLFRFLQTCEWKWHRMSYKLVQKYNNFKTYLRETAEKKANKI